MKIDSFTVNSLDDPFSHLIATTMITLWFYILDAWVWFLPIVSLFVFLLILPCFLIATVACLFRRFRTSAFRVMACIGILFLGIVAVGVTNHIRNDLPRRRAVKLGDACLAYHAKYSHYPKHLDDLVPEFISSVPAAKNGILGEDDFFYAPHETSEPFIYYECFPPFGNCYYYVESRCWKFLD
jgi:hypothetical protein